MSKKHVQHKVTYCCDQGLSFFKSELDEAVDVGIKAGVEYERERIIKLLNNDDLVSRLNTPQGNWVHLDTLLTLIKGENK